MSHATIIDRVNPFLRKANYLISCLLVLIFFLVLMVHLNQEVRDLDIWLHIKTGEQILLHRSVPLVDSYSFTKAGEAWINHEWLFQVASSLIHKHFGFDGLIAMQNMVVLAIFFILFAMGQCRRNFLFLTTLLFILLLNSSYRFTIRPDMLSVLFLVTFIFILKQAKKFLFFLPLLQILWTNSHGFFFMGPLIILIFALAQREKKLMMIFLCSSAVTIINPQLFRGAIYPIVTFFNLSRDNFVFNFVQELKSPFTLKTFFNLRDWIFLKSILIISIFSFRFNQKRFNLSLFLLWSVFLVFSLFAIRNIIYFAVVATITIFYNAKERFSYDSKLSNAKFSSKRFYYLGRFFLIFAFSFCMIKNAALITNNGYFDFDNYRFKSILWGVSLRNFPKKAVDFVLKNDLPARMYNDFNSGSYLLGRAFPSRKVFIDGRTEFYGDKFLKEYKKASSGDEEAIEKLIEEYNLEGFLLTMAMSNFDEKLAKYLFQSPEWKPVYFDESAIIFLKKIPRNRKLIKKFYIDFNSWNAPKTNLARIGTKTIYPYKNIKRAIALKEMGCFKAAISEAKEALKINPKCAKAFELLGSCYRELKDYPLALENYHTAVALAPNVLNWRNKFALILYQLDYLKEAQSELLILRKSTPKDPIIYHALALVYRQQHNLIKAEEMISRANQYSKNGEFSYLKLWADIHFELNNYKKSLNIYKLAQQKEPENSEIEKKIKNIEKLL